MNTPRENATLTVHDSIGKALARVRIRLDGGPPPYISGQYLRVGLPSSDGGLIVRPFSIASAPHEAEVELYIAFPDAERRARWPAVGGRVYLAEQGEGEMTLAAAAPGKHLLLIATGTGVAPFISMLRTLRDDSNQRARFASVTLFHGVREAEDLGYHTELQVAAATGTLRYLPLVSRDGVTNWGGLTGYAQHHLEEERYIALTQTPLSRATHEVYLCGNPAMIAAVAETLAPMGFRDERGGGIHRDRY